MHGEWYFEENDKAVGPVPIEAINQRVSLAKNKVFLVWTPGMAEWTDAREVPAFAQLYKTVPPPLPPGNSSHEDRLRVGPKDAARADNLVTTSRTLHPWRRYFARMLDYYLFALVAGFMLALKFPNFYSSLEKLVGGNDSILGLLYIALFVPFEAFCLAAFGTTFGKWLYSIRLTHDSAEKTFLDSLKRSAVVWLSGMAMGIPILTIIAMPLAYNHLKKHGLTTWDKNLGWKVDHEELSYWRWGGIISVWFLIISVIAYALSVGKAG
jgi:hypothetical protein